VEVPPSVEGNLLALFSLGARALANEMYVASYSMIMAPAHSLWQEHVDLHGNQCNQECQREEDQQPVRIHGTGCWRALV
jgi:hypothetical protein